MMRSTIPSRKKNSVVDLIIIVTLAIHFLARSSIYAVFRPLITEVSYFSKLVNYCATDGHIMEDEGTIGNETNAALCLYRTYRVF